MSHELPASSNPNEGQPDFGQLDSTSLPDTVGHIGSEEFRHQHIVGYTQDIVERKVLDGMAISGILGGLFGYAAEVIIDTIETDADARDSVQALIEVGHHGANITAIVGGLLVTLSATRSAIRTHRIRKTYDVQSDKSTS